MANAILTHEEEMALRKPIDDHVGAIQAKIDALRVDGTDKVVALEGSIDDAKRDKILTKDERERAIAAYQRDLEKAKAVESQNKSQVDALIKEAVDYLSAHYDKGLSRRGQAGLRLREGRRQANYDKRLAELEKEHQANLAKLSDSAEIKDENYVYKNRRFDAKIEYEKALQLVKDRGHEAFTHRYHLIDMLRMSKFTFAENQAQRWENYKYTFDRRQFLLRNGLYIAILAVFIGLCVAAPIVKGTQLLTVNNVLNILQQASPRMFLALGVAGLILQTGTDLSIGRMVGMGMTASTIIMHQGINTGTVFGMTFDLTSVPRRRPHHPGPSRLHRALRLLCHDRRLLHGQVQDALVHLHDGQHADHLWACSPMPRRASPSAPSRPPSPAWSSPRSAGSRRSSCGPSRPSPSCGSSGTRPRSARTCTRSVATLRPLPSPASTSSGSCSAPSCSPASSTALAPGSSACA